MRAFRPTIARPRETKRVIRLLRPRAVTGLRGTLRAEVIGFALLLVLAAALRFLWLDRIPTNITADEADNLWVIFRIDETGQPGLFGLDWKPGPAFSMHVTRAFMALFGETVFGLRSASAVLSTLALVPFYALARRVVGWPAALAAAVLLATGRWYLHFSRSGWENVHTALYALLAAWALTIALERSQLRWFVVAGVAAALGLYGYFAGRLILPALLAYAPFAWWWVRGRRRHLLTGQAGPLAVTTLAVGGRRRARTVLLGFGALTFTVLLLFLPQALTIQERWEEFDSRTESVYVFNQARPYLGETTDLGILRVQIERTVAGFLLLDGDVFDNGRYGPPGEPLYDPVTGALFVAGLGLGLFRPRATGLWWCLLLVPFLGTQVLSAWTPDGARAVIVAPFIYLFVSLAVDALLALAPGRHRHLAHLALALGVLILAAVNVGSYFAWIQTPEAAEARQPAVELVDFQPWQTALRCELRAGRFGFNVQEWQAMWDGGEAATVPSHVACVDEGSAGMPSSS